MIDLNKDFIEIELKNFTAMLSTDDKRKEEYAFFSKCAFCQIKDFNYTTPVSISQKLESKYSICSMQLASKLDYGSNQLESVTFDDDLVAKFNEIKYLGMIDRVLNIKQPESIFLKFKCLTFVNFSNNNLESIPDSLMKNECLMYLEIVNNPIKTIKNEFKGLHSLKLLEFGNLSINENDLFKGKKINKITESDLFRLPGGLEKLLIKSMPFSIIPFNLNDCKENLTELQFEGVHWPLIEEYGGVNALITLDQIQKLLDKQLTQSQITKLFKYLDSTNNNGVLRSDEIIKLNAFIYKKFPRLTPNGKNPSGVPTKVFELINLTLLNLSFQGIKFIPNEIESLHKLRVLILDNCVLLESISANVGNLPIDELRLNNCLSLKTPPPEIVRRGKDSIIAYLKRLSTGSVNCKRTKLMLVGLGEAGKTSLLNSLIDSSNHSIKPTITDGIVIKDWTIELPDRTNLTYSMWDFGKYF